MLKAASAGDGVREVLLIDAVAWSAAYPAEHPLRDVRQWYARWLTDLSEPRLACIRADEDVLSRVRGGVSGVILSGSPRDAWSEDPVNAKLCEVVRFCQARRLPFLGVCYGHQILGRALGGSVARHPRGLELGNTPVALAAAGEASPLLAGLPSRFEVLSSHADAVLGLPPETELLVGGDFTPIQGFHWQQCLFGVQFHPETDPDVLRFLWGPRRESWRGRVAFDLDAVLGSLRPTPLAGEILRNFMTRVIP